MNKYESVIIINPNVDEEGIKALISRFSDLINTDGKVEKVDELGKRKLAYDVKKFKETLAKIDTLEMNWYVPSHGIPVTRINETVELNQIAVLSTEYCVLSSLQKEKLTKEELLKRVADRNEIRLGFQQYQLINCTLNAYLVYLLEENQIAYTIEENRILWFAK